MTDIDALIGKLAQEGAVVKIVPHPYLLSLKWLCWALAYLALLFAFSGFRPDVAAKFQQPLFVAETVMLVGLLIASSVSAALLAYPDLYGKRGAAVAPAILFALFWLLIYFAWQADNPPSPLPVHSFECTVSITFVSLLPAFWTFYVLRRYASTHCGATGAVALLLAFGVGALWLRLHEVNDSVIHLIRWHYLPMIIFSAAGLWLGKKVLKW